MRVHAVVVRIVQRLVLQRNGRVDRVRRVIEAKLLFEEIRRFLLAEHVLVISFYLNKVFLDLVRTKKVVEQLFSTPIIVALLCPRFRACLAVALIR